MKASKQSREMAKAAFPDYTGRKFFANFGAEITFYDTNWGGGTRNYYKAVRLSDGKQEALADYAPWFNPAEGKTITIPDGYAVVKRSIFQGVECGLTVYYGANPLPAPAETPMVEVLRRA